MTRIVKAPDERRIEFVGTAQRLFYTRGYEKTSVNDIINEVGVSKGAFYHYFGSKQDVLLAVVDNLVNQSLSLMQTVTDDPSLDAISKFNKTREMVSSWKVERKAEMIAIAKMMTLDENMRLFITLKREGEKLFAPEWAKIISQGVEEGVFETDYPLETAKFLMSIMQSLGDEFLNIMLHPQDYEDPVKAAAAKFSAAQSAIERILNAPPESLIFIDLEMIGAWF
ncbi:MAG: TetR/AcrR family transcriptional regulator [Chloroflexota bacterium]